MNEVFEKMMDKIKKRSAIKQMAAYSFVIGGFAAMTFCFEAWVITIRDALSVCFIWICSFVLFCVYAFFNHTLIKRIVPLKTIIICESLLLVVFVVLFISWAIKRNYSCEIDAFIRTML